MPRSVFYHCSRSIWALEGQSRQSGYSLVGSRTVLRCAEQQAGSCKKRRPTFKHKVRCEPQPHSCLHSPASLSPLISSLLVFTPNLCFYLISGRPHPTTSPPSSRSTHALSPCHRRRNLYPTLSISQYKSHAYSLSSRPLGMCASRLRASAQAADGACRWAQAPLPPLALRSLRCVGAYLQFRRAGPYFRRTPHVRSIMMEFTRVARPILSYLPSCPFSPTTLASFNSKW